MVKRIILIKFILNIIIILIKTLKITQEVNSCVIFLYGIANRKTRAEHRGTVLLCSSCRTGTSEIFSSITEETAW